MESKNDSPVAPPPRDPSPASGPPTLPVLDAGANIDRRYRVLNILGRGGSALVLQVLDRLEDTVQALKILTKWEPGGVQRFQREFRLMASMRHPNIVTVNRYGVFEGHPYFTMENIQGISIRTFCQRSGIAFNQNNDPSEVLRRLLPLLTQICDALAFIHSRNVVHQDVKPANIFIRTDGAVKLMDFGIAQEPFAADAVTDLSGLLLGTVFYMSPEQVLRQPVDLRSDLYSLGVLLYELATGERPFIGPDVREVFAEIARGQPLQPRELNPHVPESFEHIISRLLERNPSRRPRSAEQLKRMLLSLPEIRAGSVIDGPETPRQGALLPPRLSGRETEVQHLTRALEALTRGASSTLHLTGPAGTGKTRLLQEFRNRASEVGALVLEGHCYQERGQPLQTLVDIIASAVLALESGAMGLAPDSRREFRARLKILLQPRTQPARAGQPTSPLGRPGERARIASAIIELLQRMMKRVPIALVIDDLHWIDPDSALLFERILPKLCQPAPHNNQPGQRKQPLLLVATSRSDELLPDAPGSRLLRALERLLPEKRLLLNPLRPDAVGDMVRSMLGTSRPMSELVSRIYDESEGTPLFVQELIYSLVDNGQLVFTGNRWDLSPNVNIEQLDGAELSAQMRNLLWQRLERLDVHDRSVLDRAAVIGEEFNFSLLERVSGRERDALLDLINRLIRDRLIIARQNMAADGEVFRFGHAHFRRLLYDELHLDPRKKLHRDIAEAIEDGVAVPNGLRSEWLAWHFALSDRPARAIIHSIAAADDAFTRLALERGINHLKRAQELWRALPPATAAALEHRYFESLDQLGKAYVRTGQYETAAEVLNDLLDRATRRGDPKWMATARLALYMPFLQTGRFDAARQQLDSALALFGQLGDEAGLARVHEGIGRIHYYRGEYDEALAHFLNAFNRAQLLNDNEMIAQSLSNMGNLYYATGRFDKAMRALRGAFRSHKTRGDRHALAKVVNSIAIIHCLSGQLFKAERGFKHYLKLVRKLEYRSDIASALMNLALIYHYMGSYRQAMRLFNQALRMSREDGDKESEAAALVNIGETLDHIGRFEAAARVLQTSLAIHDNMASPYGHMVGALALASVELQTGRYRPALEHCQQAIQLQQQIGAGVHRAEALYLRAKIYDELGCSDNARDDLRLALNEAHAKSQTLISYRIQLAQACLLIRTGHMNDGISQAETLLPALVRTGQRSVEAQLRINLGLALATAGRVNDGLRQLRSGLKIAVKFQIRPMIAVGRLHLGRVSLLIARPAAAINHLQHAATLAEAMGHQPLLWRAQANLAQAFTLTGQPQEAAARLDAAKRTVSWIITNLGADELSARYRQTPDVVAVFQQPTTG